MLYNKYKKYELYRDNVPTGEYRYELIEKGVAPGYYYRWVRTNNTVADSFQTLWVDKQQRSTDAVNWTDTGETRAFTTANPFTISPADNTVYALEKGVTPVTANSINNLDRYDNAFIFINGGDYVEYAFTDGYLVGFRNVVFTGSRLVIGKSRSKNKIREYSFSDSSVFSRLTYISASGLSCNFTAPETTSCQEVSVYGSLSGKIDISPLSGSTLNNFQVSACPEVIEIDMSGVNLNESYMQLESGAFNARPTCYSLERIRCTGCNSATVSHVISRIQANGLTGVSIIT